MNQRDACPEGLVWLADGHVSDWALNVLVDAEDSLLPEAAVTHTDTCEHCTQRLVAMATTAFALGEELALLAERQASSKTAFPLAVFGVASLFTVGVALSSWAGRGRSLVELPHELLTIGRGLRLAGPFAAQQLGVGLLILSGTSVLVAAIAGVILAKRHGFTRSPESPS